MSDKKKPKLSELFTSWCANIGRAPVEGEGQEFNRRFADADTETLRSAMDAYFGASPPPAFPTIPGLNGVYSRIVEERTLARKAAAEKEARHAGANVSPDELKAWAKRSREQIFRPVPLPVASEKEVDLARRRAEVLAKLEQAVATEGQSRG